LEVRACLSAELKDVKVVLVQERAIHATEESRMRMRTEDAETEAKKQHGLREVMSNRVDGAFKKLEEDNLRLVKQLRARDDDYIAMRGLDKAGEEGFWLERGSNPHSDAHSRLNTAQAASVSGRSKRSEAVSSPRTSPRARSPLSEDGLGPYQDLAFQAIIEDEEEEEEEFGPIWHGNKAPAPGDTDLLGFSTAWKTHMRSIVPIERGIHEPEGAEKDPKPRSYSAKTRPKRGKHSVRSKSAVYGRPAQRFPGGFTGFSGSEDENEVMEAAGDDDDDDDDDEGKMTLADRLRPTVPKIAIASMGEAMAGVEQVAEETRRQAEADRVQSRSGHYSSEAPGVKTSKRHVTSAKTSRTPRPPKELHPNEAGNMPSRASSARRLRPREGEGGGKRRRPQTARAPPRPTFVMGATTKVSVLNRGEGKTERLENGLHIGHVPAHQRERFNEGGSRMHTRRASVPKSGEAPGVLVEKKPAPVVSRIAGMPFAHHGARQRGAVVNLETLD